MATPRNTIIKHALTRISGTRTPRQIEIPALIAVKRTRSRKRPKCQLHSFRVQAERKGYPAISLISVHQNDKSLPFWLEAMPKCGRCGTCQLLGHQPLRSTLAEIRAYVKEHPDSDWPPERAR